MSMPDDTFAMVLTAIDQPQAAACMLATCQRVRAALRGPVPVCAMGPRAPMVVQIQFVSTALCLRGVEPYPGQPLFHRPGLELASARGWVQLFPLLVSHGDRWFICTFAGMGGHLALLQWARALSPPAPWGSTCTYAVLGGHLALLQWACAQVPPAPWDTSTCMAAAWGGHLKLLQWVRAQRPPAPWGEDFYRHVAEQGSLEMLQWVHGQPQPPLLSIGACTGAA